MIIFFPFGGDWLIFTHTYTKFVQRIILVLSFDTSCTSLWHCDPDLQRNAEKPEIAMVLLGGRNLKPCHSSKDAQTIINIICPHIHILCDEIYRVLSFIYSHNGAMSLYVSNYYCSCKITL